MDPKDSQLVEKYLKNDSELQVLWTEHLKFEQQLIKINRKPFLSDEEKVEKKRIQLAKLAGKTKIEEILERYRG